MSPAVKEQDVTLGAWGDELKLVLRPSGVAVLALNVKGGVNSLSSQVIEYFAKSLDFIENDKSIKAVLFASEKTDIWIAGADIREILKLEERNHVLKLASRGHEVFAQTLNCRVPVVSAIDGICLGGGLELALCCDRRVATSHPSTLLGLPEVNIGLIPGLGGTQRLPRLIGFKPAIELILSGEPISARQALAIGLVDKVVDREKLFDEAEAVALELVSSGYDRKAYREKREKEAEEKDGGLNKRLSLLKMSDRAVRIKTKGHYPAPRKAIEAAEKGLLEGIEKGLEFELDAFADLAISPVSKNMINVYFTKEMATQMALRALQQAGGVSTVGIIGGGNMGTGIAEIALKRGINVLLKSSAPEKSQHEVERLNKRSEKFFSEHPDKQGMTVPEISVAETDDDLRPAQLVVEAVYEDLDLKNKIMFELSRAVSANCVLASNTSSFAISNLSQFSNKPERVVGLHFFYPVDRMPLVEVITHERTDPNTLKKATAFVAQMGKVPIAVKDSPGFLVNRILCHFMMESSRIANDGMPLNWIEETAIEFGMPISPFWLFDEIGWDLSTRVGKLLHEKFGIRFMQPNLVTNFMTLGIDGKRSNAGFYSWDDSGKRLGFSEDFMKATGTRISEEKADEETKRMIRDRQMLTMIDEAARCLEEKVVRKARDIDMALILAIGFPPFRGGLLRYADELGIDYVVERLTEIYSKFEPRRELSPMLVKLHKEGRRFYGLGQN